ncbi:DUF4132 domain-containing protein [Nocardia sp. NPDC056100]|uniref:DUF4132 domain-containing protein n=1 Tax=Nocardia sp. NPDC056100 TaxID=3345712 RepID=UPI0035E0837D
MTELRRMDEDTWVVPGAWWARAARFRGRGPERPMRTAKKSGGSARALDPKAVRATLEATAADGPDIATAGLATLDETVVTPLGVAAVAMSSHVYLSRTYSGSAPDTAIADQWVSRYGPVFAAEAAVAVSGLEIHHGQDRRAHLRWIAPDDMPKGGAMGVVRGVRGHLANLSDADYAAAVAALEQWRGKSDALSVRIAASYLVPTEQEWLERDLAAAAGKRTRHHYYWPLLANSVTTVEQLELLAAGSMNGTPFTTPDESLYSAIVHVGPGTARLIAATIDLAWIDIDNRRSLAALLAHFPTDEAFGILLDRIAVPGVLGPLIEAARRFPRRAFRLLAADNAGDRRRTDLLEALAQLYPELAAAAGQPVRPLSSSIAFEGICAADELPEFLRTPPWEHDARAAAPAVVPGLRTTGVRLTWQPGEQERWLAIPSRWDDHGAEWPAYVDRVLGNPNSIAWPRGHVFADAPAALVAPRLAELRATDIGSNVSVAQRILARFGTAVADRVVEAAQVYTALLTDALQPLSGPDITDSMVRLLAVRKHRDMALGWLRRHIDTAALDLVAAALDKPGKQRTLTWQAVHALDENGYRAALLAAAATFGEPAAAGFEAELSADPLSRLPSRIPALPAWLLPTALPALVLRDNRRALPRDAVTAVCVMLAMHGPNGHYPGAVRVAEITDPRSRAEFAWALFDAWRGVGYPAGDGWILHALGLFGDDDTARRLTPLIRTWPGESAHQRAVTGLEVLAAIGTDFALMQLNGIAEKVKFKGIRTRAQEKIQQIAEARELTAEQLADRLVPRLGLADDGTLRLDYGPRAFLIGFDETLAPVVSDADGTRRKSLPKPGAKDDPEAGAHAYKAFTALKKDAKTVASEQVRRMERAMVDGRRWTVAEHRQLFIEHPLLWHLTRRLVWAAFDEAGALTRAFRVAEDRTLADLRDEGFVPADDLLLGIAHPLHLTEDLAAWNELFADYELLQPFPQLARETYALTDAERDGTDLTRFAGIKVPPTAVQGLTARGWERQSPQDAGNSNCFYRPVSEEFSVVVDIYPGLSAGIPPADHDPQELPHVHVSRRGHEDRLHFSTPHPFSAIDPIAASEMLRDLVRLTG